MTEVEPEWDDEARAEALILMEIEADTCSGCGQPLSETLHPGAYSGYRASDPAVCQGCKALHHKAKDYADDEDAHLLRYGVTRTWTPPADHEHQH